MKVFLDTNVILENFLEREESSIAHRLFEKLLKDHNNVLFMSVGSFYTMVFLVDKYLRKERRLIGDVRITVLRQIMTSILRTICAAEHDNDSLMRAIGNTQFKDLEDGCQFQLAQKMGCQMLITFNIADYPVAGGDSTVQVLTPQQFLDILI